MKRDPGSLIYDDGCTCGPVLTLPADRPNATYSSWKLQVNNLSPDLKRSLTARAGLLGIPVDEFVIGASILLLSRLTAETNFRIVLCQHHSLPQSLRQSDSAGFCSFTALTPCSSISGFLHQVCNQLRAPRKVYSSTCSKYEHRVELHLCKHDGTFDDDLAIFTGEFENPAVHILLSHTARDISLGFFFPTPCYSESRMRRYAEALIFVLEQASDEAPKRVGDVRLTRPYSAARLAEHFDLSSAQWGMWRNLKNQPWKENFYAISTYVRLVGNFNYKIFCAAIDHAIAEISFLRVGFILTKGKLRQRILHNKRCAVAYIDFSNDSSPEAAALRWIADAQYVGFPLHSDDHYRFSVIKVTDSLHFWFCHYSHLVLDGVGQQIVINHVARAYRELETGNLPAIESDTGLVCDYLTKDAEFKFTKAFGESRDFWINQRISDNPVTLFCRSSGNPQGVVSTRLAALPLDAVASLAASANSIRVGLPQLLISIAILYISKVSSQSTLTVGIPSHGRESRDHLQAAVPAANILPVTFEIDCEASFLDFVRYASRTLGEALKHRLLRIEDIRSIRAANPADRFYNILINALPFPDEYNFGSLRGVPDVVTPRYVEDITVWLFSSLRSEQVGIRIDGNAARYEQWEVDAHLDNILSVSKAVAHDAKPPASVVATIAIKDSQAAWVKGTRRELPAASVLSLFRRAIDEAPNATAIEIEGRSISYGDLNKLANRFANFVNAHRSETESPTVIVARRSIEMIAAMLGAMKASVPYLPLDADQPVDRLRHMLSDICPSSLLVTQRTLPEEIETKSIPTLFIDIPRDIERFPTTSLESEPTKDCPSYYMYTSGSSGEPKAVAISHKSMLNHNLAMVDLFDLRSTDRVLQFSSISFDASVEEIFTTLIVGATLVIMSEKWMTTERFIRFVENNRVSVLNLPVAYWEKLTVDCERTQRQFPSNVRLVIVGGEAVSLDAYKRWLRVKVERTKWLNTYGPTEATVVCTAYNPEASLESCACVPIGRPICNSEVHILDGALMPAPLGVAGEIFIGGISPGLGYVNREDLNRHAFLDDVLGAGSGRLYRTGDVARFLPDGNIEFLGRRDRQLKIGGHRVELAEIETAILKHPNVAACVTDVRQVEDQKLLVSYFVRRDKSAQTPAWKILEFARDFLPSYMLPSHLIEVAELPLDKNGKIDRRKLPNPQQGLNRRPPYDPPVSEVEILLATIWERILKVGQIGLNDRFFDLGGTSLSVLEVGLELEDRLAKDISLGIFERGTLKEIAAKVATMDKAISRAEQERFLGI